MSRAAAHAANVVPRKPRTSLRQLIAQRSQVQVLPPLQRERPVDQSGCLADGAISVQVKPSVGFRVEHHRKPPRGINGFGA